MAEHTEASHVVGGVDTHKDLHVAAVADHQDRFLGVESFTTTRHRYRLMLAWMRSFGDLPAHDFVTSASKLDFAGSEVGEQCYRTCNRDFLLERQNHS